MSSMQLYPDIFFCGRSVYVQVFGVQYRSLRGHYFWCVNVVVHLLENLGFMSIGRVDSYAMP